jgi:hypothetical protein
MKLNTIQPAEGSKKERRRVVASVLALVKQQAVVTKVKNLALAVSIKSALKAVKCLCSVVCQSVVLHL